MSYDVVRGRFSRKKRKEDSRSQFPVKKLSLFSQGTDHSMMKEIFALSTEKCPFHLTTSVVSSSVSTH